MAFVGYAGLVLTGYMIGMNVCGGMPATMYVHPLASLCVSGLMLVCARRNA